MYILLQRRSDAMENVIELYWAKTETFLKSKMNWARLRQRSDLELCINVATSKTSTKTWPYKYFTHGFYVSVVKYFTGRQKRIPIALQVLSPLSPFVYIFFCHHNCEVYKDTEIVRMTTWCSFEHSKQSWP